MSTKLTLTINKDVIEEAKVYAKKQGRSLSNLIEDYLKILISSPEPTVEKFAYSPTVLMLKGAVAANSAVEDYQNILAEELMKKYEIS